MKYGSKQFSIVDPAYESGMHSVNALEVHIPKNDD
jgi:hypothetical protein